MPSAITCNNPRSRVRIIINRIITGYEVTHRTKFRIVALLHVEKKHTFYWKFVCSLNTREYRAAAVNREWRGRALRTKAAAIVAAEESRACSWTCDLTAGCIGCTPVHCRQYTIQPRSSEAPPSWHLSINSSLGGCWCALIRRMPLTDCVNDLVP